VAAVGTDVLCVRRCGTIKGGSSRLVLMAQGDEKCYSNQTEVQTCFTMLTTFKIHFYQKARAKKDLYYNEILLRVEFQTALSSLGRTAKFKGVRTK
jgi:hypothetical protein